MQEEILKNIAKHIDLDEAEAEYFLSLLVYKKLQKQAYVLMQNQPCKNINYVVQGALRACYMSKDEKEHTIMFAMADWWVTDMYCFVHGLPAMMYVQAIEDSIILQLSKEKMDLLLEKIPKFERFFRILMQNAYTREQLRVMQNLSLTAEEKYGQFLLKYPQIAQQVTQKQIASYLGITPEFLSAIRNMKAKK